MTPSIGGSAAADKYRRLPACQGIFDSRLFAHILAMSSLLLILLFSRGFVGRGIASLPLCLAANNIELSEVSWRKPLDFWWGWKASIVWECKQKRIPRTMIFTTETRRDASKVFAEATSFGRNVIIAGRNILESVQSMNVFCFTMFKNYKTIRWGATSTHLGKTKGLK